MTAFRIGDAICAYPEFGRGGSHADFVHIDANQAAPMPAKLSFVQTSAIPMTSQAAFTALDAAAVRSGEHVLIHGAAGAVGHWLIQLAKAKGAYVIATASGPRCDDCRSLGADQTIDYHTQRFGEAGPVDVVFDLIGGETQARS